MITMSHGIKEPLNFEEIIKYVAPSATSDCLISTEKEDTESSSGYEEGSNRIPSQSTTDSLYMKQICY